MKGRAAIFWILGASVVVMLALALQLMHSKGGQMIFGRFTLNDSSIVFYGKLEDQFGNGVSNAPVNFEVRVDNGLRSGVERGVVVSDGRGRFTISGYHGERLGVVPRLPGYAIASENRQAIYSLFWPANQRMSPNPTNPVVIKLWKLQGAEPLVGIDRTFKMHYTDQPICFDVLTGTIVTDGGDLRIRVKRPNGEISERNPQVWSVHFEAIDGGMMDSAGTERITYVAPEGGYLPSKDISSSDRLPESGIGGFSTGFYVKSRKGLAYSKLRVSVGINEGPEDLMYFQFRGISNTNGSRNWEGDSNTYRPQ